MTTARDLITLAFKEAGVLGVGQTLLAEDTNDGYTLLRTMMAQWQKRRWLVPAEITLNALGNDAISNTIGDGGHWDYPIRPDYISYGYVVQVGTGVTPVSLPLRPLNSRRDYDQIALKELNTLPQYYYYDGLWPLGNVYVWPIPSSTYRIYLSIKANLAFPVLDPDANPTGLDSVIELPPEYEETIRLNLAIRICSAYGKQPKPVTATLAKLSLNTVKNANAQVAQLNMPDQLNRGRAFNIYNPDGY